MMNQIFSQSDEQFEGGDSEKKALKTGQSPGKKVEEVKELTPEEKKEERKR